MSDGRTITCPKCAAKLRLKQSAAGKKVKCPGCSTPFRIAASSDRPGLKRNSSPSTTGKPAAVESGRPAGKKTSAPKKRSSSQPSQQRTLPAKKKRRKPVADDVYGSEYDDLAGDYGSYDDDFGAADDGGYGSYDDDYGAYDEPAPAPPRRSRKSGRTAKRSTKKSPEGRSFQQSIHAMGFLGWIASGGLAGLVGVGLTTLMGVLDIEFMIGVMALVTGSMVGGAIRFAATPTQGWGPGLLAVAIAFASIMAGKVGAFYFWTGELMGDDIEWTLEDEIADSTSESAMIGEFAYKVQEEWLASGQITEQQIEQHFDQQLEEDYEDYEEGEPYDYSTDYLPEVWQEATNRWNALGQDEQEKKREEVRNEIRQDWIGEDLDENMTDQELQQEIEGDVQKIQIVVAIIAAFVNIFFPLYSLFFFCSGLFGSFKLASNLGTGE